MEQKKTKQYNLLNILDYCTKIAMSARSEFFKLVQLELLKNLFQMSGHHSKYTLS